MAEKRPQTGKPLPRAIGFDSTYASVKPSFSFDLLGTPNYCSAHRAAYLQVESLE